jgi:transcriptional regulator with XRE-family HTH domain
MPQKKQENMSLGDNFGERLHNLRKNKGLTQSGLAKQLGFKHNSPVSNIESNKISPDIQTLIKIGEIFKTDLHWLITGNPAPSSNQQDKNYQRIFADLGKQISWSIAVLLGERDAKEEDAEELAKRMESGEDLGSEMIGIVRDTAVIQQRISELVRLQSEMQKMLSDLLVKDSKSS